MSEVQQKICPLMHTFMQGPKGPELVTARCVGESCAWWDEAFSQCCKLTIANCLTVQSYEEDEEEDGDDGDEPESPEPDEPQSPMSRIIEMATSVPPVESTIHAAP